MNQTHKTLLSVAGMTLFLTVMAHLYLLKPKLSENKNLSISIKKVSDELRDRDKSWNLSPQYFQALKIRYDRIRNKRLDGLREVFVRANDEFKKLIDPIEYGQTVKQWRSGLFIMSFGEAYYNTMDEMKGINVNLDERVLGIRANQIVRRRQVYRKLAHLYVVREVVKLAKANGLKMTDAEMTADWCNENGEKNEFVKQPAMVMIKTMRSFFVQGETRAFMDEFPVEIRVRGKLRQLSKFVTALTLGKRFLPIDTISVRAIGAEKYLKSLKFSKHGVENMVEARMTVSGFLVHEDVKKLSNKRLKIKQRKPLPKGA